MTNAGNPGGEASGRRRGSARHRSDAPALGITLPPRPVIATALLLGVAGSLGAAMTGPYTQTAPGPGSSTVTPKSGASEVDCGDLDDDKLARATPTATAGASVSQPPGVGELPLTIEVAQQHHVDGNFYVAIYDLGGAGGRLRAAKSAALYRVTRTDGSNGLLADSVAVRDNKSVYVPVSIENGKVRVALDAPSVDVAIADLADSDLGDAYTDVAIVALPNDNESPTLPSSYLVAGVTQMPRMTCQFVSTRDMRSVEMPDGTTTMRVSDAAVAWKTQVQGTVPVMNVGGGYVIWTNGADFGELEPGTVANTLDSQVIGPSPTERVIDALPSTDPSNLDLGPGVQAAGKSTGLGHGF